ncbi:MAG: hypothetical protein AB7K71_39835 [Polyangiaceae bacterium]
MPRAQQAVGPRAPAEFPCLIQDRPGALNGGPAVARVGRALETLAFSGIAIIHGRLGARFRALPGGRRRAGRKNPRGLTRATGNTQRPGEQRQENASDRKARVGQAPSLLRERAPSKPA